MCEHPHAAKKDQLNIEKARIESQKEIAGMQIGAKIQKDKEGRGDLKYEQLVMLEKTYHA